jgi:hypothetical protein
MEMLRPLRVRTPLPRRTRRSWSDRLGLTPPIDLRTKANCHDPRLACAAFSGATGPRRPKPARRPPPASRTKANCHAPRLALRSRDGQGEVSCSGARVDFSGPTGPATRPRRVHLHLSCSIDTVCWSTSTSNQRHSRRTSREGQLRNLRRFARPDCRAASLFLADSSPSH